MGQKQGQNLKTGDSDMGISFIKVKAESQQIWQSLQGRNCKKINKVKQTLKSFHWENEKKYKQRKKAMVKRFFKK